MVLLQIVLAFAAGAFWWFMFEYLLHRFAFHEMKGKGVGWGWLADTVVNRPVGIAFGVAWVFAYFFYEWHHRASHLRGPRNEWERWLRVHHFHHHFGHPLTNQGVTISLWDHVFRTNVSPEKVRVPRRLVMPWLIDENGEVLPEHRDDYELVGNADLDERQAGIDRARAFANLVPTS